MKFAGFLQRFDPLTAPAGELYIVAAAVLLMFMIAIYLLLQRGSVWYMASGLAIAGAGALYALTMSGLVSLDKGPMSEWLGRALTMLGLV